MQSDFTVEVGGVADLATITMIAGAGVVKASEGTPARISGDATVVPAADGERIDGLIVNVDEANQICAVRLVGIVELKIKSGETIAAGVQAIVAAAAGEIKAQTTPDSWNYRRVLSVANGVAVVVLG